MTEQTSKQVTNGASRRPPNAGKGRKKGTPNKVTASVKEAFLLAHQGIGGAKALTEWAKANPTEFYKLLARLIPTEVTGPNGGPIQHETQVWQIGERTVRF